MRPLTRGWTGHVLAIVAGALITPSLAPFDLWPLGLLSLGLLRWLLDDASPGGGFVRGWCYGLGLFGTGTSWVYVSIHVYGYAPIPLAVFLTALFSAGLALFTAVIAWAYVRWVRDLALGRSLGFAAVLTLGEWWRTWFLTGFPWLFPGYAHIYSPLAGWAPVVGIYGIDFILALTAALLVEQFQQRRIPRWGLVALAIGWAGGGLLGVVSWVEPADREPLKIAMVQANIPQAQKWLPEQFQPTLALYQRMDEPLWADNDIVIWPEAAVPGFYFQAETFLDAMAQRASDSDTTLLTGILSIDRGVEPPVIYNSVMALGEGSGIYHKRRLVPFGEYVPLEAWLRGLIAFFDLPMSNLHPGPADQQGLTSGDLLLAPFICYEVVYPDLVASWTPEADLLLTISNDAWFGTSIGPLQHLQMAQMRALENGRYLLRSTGSGVTAIVDHHGNLTVVGEQFSRQVITGTAQVMTGTTPFAATGSWPILLACALLCIGLQLFTAKMRG